MTQAKRGTIVVGGRVYRFSALTLGQARRYNRALDELVRAGQAQAPTTVSEAFDKMLALTPLMLESLRAAHPEITQEELENAVTTQNLKDFIQAMLDACWPEGVQVPQGEAVPAAA